jgi:hypothetical protein
MLSMHRFLLLYFMSLALCLFGQSPTGSFTPTALDGIAAANRVEIQRGVEQLMRLERAENWIAMADLMRCKRWASARIIGWKTLGVKGPSLGDDCCDTALTAPELKKP